MNSMQQFMNDDDDHDDYERHSWIRDMEAVMNSDPVEQGQLESAYDTAHSVGCYGVLPAIAGQPAREVSIEEQTETLRYLVSLTEEVPEPI